MDIHFQFHFESQTIKGGVTFIYHFPLWLGRDKTDKQRYRLINSHQKYNFQFVDCV